LLNPSPVNLPALDPIWTSRHGTDDRAAPLDAPSATAGLDVSLRDCLLSALSHDLRTPLAAIKIAVTSLLCDDVDWDGQGSRQLANTINDEADRLARLLENLLDTQRIEAGVATAFLASVPLEDVLEDATTSLGVAGSQVTIDIPNALPRVTADRGLLERATANVIANAVAWSPPETAVRVSAAVVGDRVDLRVSDRGPGVRAEERDCAFLPFRILGRPANRSHNGVGLGLAVARGFTRACGGALTIEDTPGGGATFLFSLRTAQP
jgi:two-component system sensor histidine kinase KdpD